MTMPASVPVPGVENSFAIRTQRLNLWYGTFQALFDIEINVEQGLKSSVPQV